MPKKKWDEPVEKIYANVPQSHKVNLKIKLHHHGLTQSNFLRGVVKAFLQDDENFITWFDAWKLRNSKVKAAHHHKRTDKLTEQGKELSAKFGINDGEIESIFDLLEKEHPEL
tara:strand:+ start:155 stop:493 length:339 start_codon:yes stop_codon:yes gene_type:complete